MAQGNAQDKMKSSGGVTYSQAGEGYFEKRQLKRTAGFWGGLWGGIGVAAVISGDFSGWNFGIGEAGWGGGLAIASVVIVIMYFGMLFSIGEMSAAMPHTGGAYSFARAAMGPWGAGSSPASPRPSSTSSPPRSSCSSRPATPTR